MSNLRFLSVIVVLCSVALVARSGQQCGITDGGFAEYLCTETAESDCWPGCQWNFSPYCCDDTNVCVLLELGACSSSATEYQLSFWWSECEQSYPNCGPCGEWRDITYSYVITECECDPA